MINVIIVYFLYFGFGLLGYLQLSQQSFKDNPAKAFGESFLLGALFVIFINNIAQLFSIDITPKYFIVVMFTVSSLSIIVVTRWMLKDLSGSTFSQWKQAIKDVSIWHYLALLLIAVHFYLIVSQSSVLPLTPWDAWIGWVAKAKIWVFHGLNEPLLDRFSWLLSDSDFTNPTAHYPDGLPLLYFVNSGMFAWNEPALSSIYPALFIAILLAMYGNIRCLSNNKVLAWTAVFLMATMPFVNVHITLAGYADIWVASYLFMLMMAAQRFITAKNIKTLLLLLIYSTGLVMFKLESWIWMLGVYVVLILALMTFKIRIITLCLILVAFVIWVFVGGFTFTSPLGEFIIQPHLIKIPMLGAYELGFKNTSQAWLESLFLSYNWSLLWFSLPLAIILPFKIKDKSQLVLPASYLIFVLLFLFVLFYMTAASVWANDFTSSNRIVLHIVPIYIYFLLRVFDQWQKERLN